MSKDKLPKMTRAHFQLVAEIVGKTARAAGVQQSAKFDAMVHTAAGMLYSTNPRFSRERFILACWDAWEKSDGA